jgi:tetratricopeptide (TPR) repeat protein
MLCAILAWHPLRAQNLELPAPSTPRLAAVRDLLGKGETWEAIRAMRRQSKYTAEDKLWLGVAYYLAGQHKLFALMMAEASDGLPRNPFPPYALGRYHLDIRGRAGEARAAFEEALRRSPAYAPGLYHLGWCHELDRDLDKALELYGRAPGYWLAHLGIARIAMTREDLVQARLQAERAIALKPDAAMARLLYGRVLERAGELRLALEQFETAATLDPTDSSGLYQAVRCARKLEDGSRAASLLKRYRDVVDLYGPSN